MLEICRVREVDPQQQLFRVSIDKGQEFDKFSLSVVDFDEDGNETATNSTSGVNKMHLFAITVCDESYDLFYIVLAKVNFYDCKYTFVGDLKAIMLFCGLMTCASTWPCYACDIHKDSLEEEGELRTVGSLVANHEKYQQNLLEAKPKPPKDPEFKGSHKRPLLVKEGEIDEEFLSQTVLSIIPPPSLHLMLGIVGDVQELLISVWPGAIEWSKSLNVWPDEGGPRNKYRGNDCKILLANVNALEQLAVLENKFELIKPIIHFYTL